MRKFLDWITGKSKYMKLIEEQQRVIISLQDQFAFIEPVRSGEQDNYECFVHGVWSNRYFKWFLFQMERAVITKFKSSGEGELHRGQLSMIEIITTQMKGLSDIYQLKQIQSTKNE